MSLDKVKQGKRNRANGAAFELRVRKDLIEKGWIVDKWSNNVELGTISSIMDDGCKFTAFNGEGKLVKTKNKWAGAGRPMMMGGGFPDFVCIKVHDLSNPQTYNVQFVECKINGTLDKMEKQKCKWMVEQGYNILIASKTKVKNRIIIKYENFVERYGI